MGIVFSIFFRIAISVMAAKPALDLKPAVEAAPKAEKPADDHSSRLTNSFDTLAIGKQNMRIEPEGVHYTRQKTEVARPRARAPVDEHAKSQKPSSGANR